MARVPGGQGVKKSESKSNAIQIHELRILTTGLTKERARQMGQTVAERLATLKVAADGTHEIPHLKVSIQGSDRSVEHIAHEISRRIARELNSK